MSKNFVTIISVIHSALDLLLEFTGFFPSFEPFSAVIGLALSVYHLRQNTDKK